MDRINYQLLKEKGLLINIRGSKGEFIKFGGLQLLAKEQGLKSVTTELVKLDNTYKDIDEDGKTIRIRASGLCIFKATVSGENGTFTAYGDASPKNVSQMIAPHLIRMAETRSIARALRLYTACQYTSDSEMIENFN